jgi:hypothetical protein
MKNRRLATGLAVLALLATQANVASAKGGEDDSTKSEIEAPHHEDAGDDNDAHVEDHTVDPNKGAAGTPDEEEDSHVEDGHVDGHVDSSKDRRPEPPRGGDRTARGQDKSSQKPEEVKAWETERKSIEDEAKSELAAAKVEYRDERESATSKSEREAATKKFREAVKKIETDRRDALKDLGPKPKMNSGANSKGGSPEKNKSMGSDKASEKRSNEKGSSKKTEKDSSKHGQRASGKTDSKAGNSRK